MVHALQIRALRDDAQILVHGQNLGGAGPEDRLRIGQDDLVHDVCSACACPYPRKCSVSTLIFAKPLERLNHGACCFHSPVPIGTTARNLGNVCNCYMYETLLRFDAQSAGLAGLTVRCDPRDAISEIIAFQPKRIE